MYSSFAVAASFGALRLLGSSDLNVVYASPATAAAPALVAKLRHGVPYVLVVQDVWPDSVFAAGFLTEGPIHRTAHDWLSTFVNSVYRHASHIVVISEGMRRLLISRGVPAERLTVIYNWASEQDGLSPLTFPNRSKVEPLHLMYAGNVGAPQGLDNVIRALARVPREKFHFTIVGGGSGLQSLRELVRREGLSNVDFKEPVSPSALRQLQAGAHVHLVSLIDDPLFRVTIPSKLQELMNSGVAILAVAPGEVADLVSQAAAGLAVTPGDDSTLADALMDLSDRPNEWFSACGLSGRRFYQARMGSAVGRQGYQEAIRKSIMDHVD
jgi:glycosyltransferase involved in cell wall biosynthesis